MHTIKTDALSMAASARNGQEEKRTAAEAGWHASRYNLYAEVPGTDSVAIANLYRGTCAEYGPFELYALSALDELREDHPLVRLLAERGIICNFDERAALEAMGRMATTGARHIFLTICPTLSCNFDCPYCFEAHTPGRMDAEVADDVVELAGRMMDAFGAHSLHVTWYGGEPLLAADVIEALSGRLIALAVGHGATYDADVITNGYLLTAEVTDMLARARVTSAQVTLDGVGAVHDATRHLAGGGPTFERIVGNLSRPGLPFPVKVRHNVHTGNDDQADPLADLVARIARESGNTLSFHAVPVTDNEESRRRGSQIRALAASDVVHVTAAQAHATFGRARGHACGAQLLSDVCVDERGRLCKCWEAVGKTAFAFGLAHDWDPADPLATATNPDLLTRYLDTGAPVPDEECLACVWLPACRGGCPHRRLFGADKRCTPHRRDPEGYVLSLLPHLRRTCMDAAPANSV